jgi:hypothetical protein
MATIADLAAAVDAFMATPKRIAGADRLRRRGRNMSDETVKTARLMKVVEVMVAELARQGVVETLADLDFDPMALAKVVIKAADGDVIDLNSHR